MAFGPDQGPRPSASMPESAHLSNASGTAKKLKFDGDINDIRSSQETRDERSIVCMFVLHSLITLFGKCLECPSSILLLVANDLRVNKGFRISFKLNCSHCNLEYSTYTLTKILNTDRAGSTKAKTFEVYIRTVLASREIGRGRTACETFAQSLTMPNCIIQVPYDSIKKSFLRSYTEVSQAIQAKAAKETKEGIVSSGIDDDVDCSVFCGWNMANGRWMEDVQRNCRLLD